MSPPPAFTHADRQGQIADLLKSLLPGGRALPEQAGFETVFIGAFGTSASMLGLPDLNFLTMSEMADAVRRMAARVGVPVIADGDTGYGDLHNVQRTVEAFEAAGASGILLEDQVMPKRCGHFANKRVIPSEEMVLKIKAAVKAKSDPDFVIFARTDARQMNGLDDAIDRVNRCCDSGGTSPSSKRRNRALNWRRSRSV